MTLKRPLVMQAGGVDPTFEYSAQEERVLISAIYRSEGVVLHGSTGADSLKVSQRAAGANFSVDVASGFAVIDGDDVADQGMYIVRNTATVNVVVPAAPASGSVVHRVIAQVEDRLHEGTWADYVWNILLLEDTGSGTPALPASAIDLALVTVASTTTSITASEITDNRTPAVILAARARTAASAADRPTNPPTGYMLFRTDLGDMETWNASAWIPSGLNRPFAQLSRSTNYGIATATVVMLPWNAEVSDTHGGHSTTTNTTRYTAQVAGVYAFDCSIPWVANATGARELSFRKTSGATTTTYNGSRFAAGSAVTVENAASRKIPLAVGDYVEVGLYQTSGITLDVDQSFGGGPGLDVTWLRPLP